MAFTARHRFARISPTKVRHIARMIQGMSVPKALDTLEFTTKKGARMLEKVLRSAVANAGTEAKADEMVVESVRIDDGPVALGTKRFIPVSRGMAHAIRKRTSHIFVQIDSVAKQEEQ